MKFKKKIIFIYSILLLTQMFSISNYSISPFLVRDTLKDETKTKDEVAKKKNAETLILPENIKNQTINENNTTELASYKGFKKDSFIKGKEWQEGLITHYLKYTILSIVKHNSVYDNIFCNFYAKNFLISNGVDVAASSNKKISRTMGEALSFQSAIDFETACFLSAEAGIYGINDSTNISFKANVGLTQSNVYTYSTVQTYELNVSLHLGAEQARQCCPDGYDISVGYYGEFYTIEVLQEEYEVYLWGDYNVDYGKRNKKFKTIISNESELTLGYIYKKNIVEPHC